MNTIDFIENNHALLFEFSKLNLIGRCSAFVENITLIKKIANWQATVLIQGETGTGKENAARAIHYLGNRRNQSFIPVNCAAIPDDLIESELFGHEKGAFTDAKQQQVGLITLANKGTLFLDEVDSLSHKAQAVLLRFLQTQEYRPLGSRQLLRADVRIIVATNADLREKVNAKSFREDLFFRLNVLNLVMPPLRERLDDIPLLCESFLERFSMEYQTATKKISPSCLNFLMQQYWPGNIRELENCLLRAFLLSAGNTLEFQELNSDHYKFSDSDTEKATEEDTAIENPIANFFSNNKSENFQEAKAKLIVEFEAHYLKQIMRKTHGNVSAAARMAGKERRALGKLLQKYEIDKMQFC
jgi:DNA-binding NtrC family response regulator